MIYSVFNFLIQILQCSTIICINVCTFPVLFSSKYYFRNYFSWKVFSYVYFLLSPWLLFSMVCKVLCCQRNLMFLIVYCLSLLKLFVTNSKESICISNKKNGEWIKVNFPSNCTWDKLKVRKRHMQESGFKNDGLKSKWW